MLKFNFWNSITMFDKIFRIIKENHLRDIPAFLPLFLTPNVLTTIGGALGLLTCILLWFGLIYSAIAIWLISRVFDGLDGLIIFS